MSQITKQILRLCALCDNVASSDELQMSKKDWDSLYGKLKRHPEAAQVFGDEVIIGMRKEFVGNKPVMQLLTRSEGLCDIHMAPEILELPFSIHRTHGIEFQQVDTKDLETKYRCSRCTKPVPLHPWIRDGLIYGYRCARRLATRINRGEIENLYSVHADRENDNENFAFVVYVELDQSYVLNNVTPDEMNDLLRRQELNEIKIKSRVRNYTVVLPKTDDELSE